MTREEGRRKLQEICHREIIFRGFAGSKPKVPSGSMKLWRGPVAAGLDAASLWGAFYRPVLSEWVVCKANEVRFLFVLRTVKWSVVETVGSYLDCVSLRVKWSSERELGWTSVVKLPRRAHRRHRWGAELCVQLMDHTFGSVSVTLICLMVLQILMMSHVLQRTLKVKCLL